MIRAFGAGYPHFCILKKKTKMTLYFNAYEPRLDPSLFVSSTAAEFKKIYRDASDELSKQMPDPRGWKVTTTVYVDASHASNCKTRGSHSGFIIFVNLSPTEDSRIQHFLERVHSNEIMCGIDYRPPI